jgi:predicted regulator of amino acid metabolism with ACT domain
MGLTTITADDTVKIKTTVEAGIQVLREVDTLKEDMKTYVTSLAEELDIKPATISKAIKLAFKNEKDNAIQQAQEEMTDVEVILHAAGKI